MPLQEDTLLARSKKDCVASGASAVAGLSVRGSNATLKENKETSNKRFGSQHRKRHHNKV